MITALMSSEDPAQVAQGVELLRAMPELILPVSAALARSVHSLDDLTALTEGGEQATRYRRRFARCAARRAAQTLAATEQAALQTLIDGGTVSEVGRRVDDIARALRAASRPTPTSAGVVEEHFLRIAQHRATIEAQAVLDDGGLSRVMRERIAASVREGAVRAARQEEWSAMHADLRRLAGELLTERIGQ